MNRSRSLALIVALLLSALTVASSPGKPYQTKDAPPYAGYKGVTIGMSMQDARAKLGSPREKSDAQDFYVFSDRESAQVFYDADKKVSALTVTYTGGVTGIPDPKAVFGEDAEANADGGIFKMVRYPKVGYWISYNKIVGDDPIIMIAVKKM